MAIAPQASPMHVLVFSEIKTAVEEFERGEANLLQALGRIKESLALFRTLDTAHQRDAA